MADETAKTSLVFDASGAKAGADQFAAAGEKVISTNDKVLKSTERQSAALDRFARQWDPVLAAASRAGRQLDSVFDIFQKTEGSIKAKAFELLTPAIDRANKSLRDLAAGFDVAARVGQLSAKFDPLTTSARAMTGELKDLNDALKLGVVDGGQYLAWQQKIIEKYDEGAQAAKRAASAQREMIEQARAAQNTTNAQQAFNQQLGVRQSPGTVGGRAVSDVKSAQESAAIFEEDAKAAEEAAKALQEMADRAAYLAGKFDPVTASAQKMTAELAELNEAQQMGITIAGGYEAAYAAIVEKYDEGAQAAAKQAEAQRQAAEAQRAAIEEMKAQTAATDQAAAAQQHFNQLLGVRQSPGTVGGQAAGSGAKSAAASASVFQQNFEDQEKQAALRQRLINQFDPLTVAAQRYARIIGEINLAESEGILKTAEATKLRDAESASYGKVGSSADAAKKYLGNFGDAAFGARFATQQLGVQTIQFFSSLQAGQPFMQAFIGQAHQVVDVAIATGTGFRTIADAIKGWITGLAGWVRANPIVAGAAAAVAALAALGAMAESTQRRLGTLRTELSGTRDDYQQASVRAEEASKFLARNTELSTSDSRKAAQTLFSDPTFNGTDEQVKKIAVTFSNLSKILGESETNWKRMGDAMHDPVKVLDELAGKGLTQITPALRRLVQDLAESGHQAEAFRMVMDALAKQTAGVEANLTPMQKALNELSKEFTSAAQGGRSMADIVGSIVDTAAVAAITTLTEIVKEFKAIYDLIKDLKPPDWMGSFAKDFWDMLDPTKLAKDVSGGIRNVFDISGTRDWLRKQAASPGAEPTSVSSAGALGTMQLMPGTAQSLGVNPFIQSENILGGVKYIQQLAGKFGPANLDMISRAYNVGPSGHLWAAGGYASSVAGADISKLPTETATQIETAGRSIGLSSQLIELAKRIAVVENKGRQGPVSEQARYVDPHKGGEILTGAKPEAETAGTGGGTTGPMDRRGPVDNYGKGDMTTQQAIALAEEYRKKLGMVADEQHKNEVGLEALKKGRKEAFDAKDTAEVERLDKAIAAMNGQIYRTISPQEQLARQTKQQADAAQALTEGDQKLLQVQQQIDELNKQHPDTASAESDAKIRSAALQQMSGEYRRLSFEIGLQIKEQNSLADAYGKGYDAVAHATAANKALIDSMKLFPQGSKEQIEAAKALTDQYEKLARATQEVQAAQMHAQNRDTVEQLNAEVDALSMGSLERERYLAHVQKEIELKRQLPNLSKEARDALVAENDAIVAQQQALKVHQAAMDELAGAFTQSFDTIGNAITQSFVQGTGAAVNWKNVMTSVLQQVVQQFMKLSILNPALNALFGTHRPTLEDAFNTPQKMALPGAGAANDNTTSAVGAAAKVAGQIASANDNAQQSVGGKVVNAITGAAGGLPIDSATNAMRVTVVGGSLLGGLGGSGGSGSPATGIANEVVQAAKKEADQPTEGATKNVGTAGSEGGGGLFSWLGKQASSVWDGFKNLFGGSSDKSGSGGSGSEGSSDGFLSKIGKLIGNFPGGILNSLFGDKFYEHGGLIGSLFGSGSGAGGEDLPVPPIPPDMPTDVADAAGGAGDAAGGLGDAAGGLGDSWDLSGAIGDIGAAHRGALIGVDRLAPRAVNPLAFLNAPRFHTGLNNDEFATVLQKGERVLTANQNNRLENMFDYALPKAGGMGAMQLGRTLNGMSRGQQSAFRANGDVTNNNGHTINVHVPGGMSSDEARRTGYQVGAAVASRLNHVSMRNAP